MAEFKFDKPRLLWSLPFEGAWTTSVAFLGSKQKLAAGNREGQLFVWDLPEEAPPEPAKGKSGDKKSDTDEAQATPPPALRLDGHTNGVTHLLATADGKQLVSSSLDHTVRIWDMTAAPSGAAEVVMDSETREKKAKRDKSVLEQPGAQVKLHTAHQELAGHTDWVNGLGLSRDEQRLITGDDACQVIVWDFPARKQLASWLGHPGNWVSTAALSADGKLAFVGEYCSKRGDFDRPPAQARIYDAATGAEKVDLLQVQFPKVKQRDNSYGYANTWVKFVKRGFVASDFSPDGKLLAMAQGGETDTGKAHLIDTATGKLVRTVSGGHRYGMTDVKFSVDGKYVLTTGRDTMLRICQVSDGKEVAHLHDSRGGQFKDWLLALAVSPDQQRLAAADSAGLVHVWSLSG